MAKAPMLTKREIDRVAKRHSLTPSKELHEFAVSVFIYGLRTAHADVVKACNAIETEIKTSSSLKDGK